MPKYSSVGKYLGPLERIGDPGKSRDTFNLDFVEISGADGCPCMLIVASDRISTHNIVHNSLIPFKGEVLTAMTILWLTGILAEAGIPHHLVVYGAKIYDWIGPREDYPDDIHRQAIIVKKLDMVMVEFIFRQYLTGSLYSEYHKNGKPNPYGVKLDPCWPLMQKFPAPVFTPTEKSKTDDPLNAAETRLKHTDDCELTYQAFILIRNHLRSVGLELVDSKFEVGRVLGQPKVAVLADEIVTPDSSRFVSLDQIKLGQDPPWRDKQIARDAAMTIWNGGPKVPVTFDDLTIKQLTDTYLSLFAQIHGASLSDFQKHRLD